MESYYRKLLDLTNWGLIMNQNSVRLEGSIQLLTISRRSSNVKAHLNSFFEIDLLGLMYSNDVFHRHIFIYFTLLQHPILTTIYSNVKFKIPNNYCKHISFKHIYVQWFSPFKKHHDKYAEWLKKNLDKLI